MKLGTLKIIVNLMNMASTDAARPHINGVHIVVKDKGIQLRVTDGCMAMRVNIEDDYLSAGELFIDRGQLKSIQSFIKEHGRYIADNLDLELSSEVNGESVRSFLKSTYTSSVVKLSDSQVKFPRIEEFYKIKEVDGVEIPPFIGMDARLIDRIHKAMGSPKNGGMRFRITGLNTAVLITREVDGLIYDALLMPTRL